MAETSFRLSSMLIKRNSMEAQGNTKAGPGKKPRKPKFAPITLSEEEGVIYLHFGNEWIQGAMRIRKPDWLELEYAQQMMAGLLFNQDPQHFLQLGLGTGALSKFSYRQFPKAQVTAVDLNPQVISVSRSMFRLPPDDDRLSVREMDAMEFVTDVHNHGKFDLLQVDLYDALVQGPVLDTPEFYEGCAACLTQEGVMTVNLFGDHPSYARNIKAMKHAFAEVINLPPCHSSNVVALAFKTRPELDFEDLYERAAQISAATKLPAKNWVNGIKAWLAEKEKPRRSKTS